MSRGQHRHREINRHTAPRHDPPIVAAAAAAAAVAAAAAGVAARGVCSCSNRTTAVAPAGRSRDARCLLGWMGCCRKGTICSCGE